MLLLHSEPSHRSVNHRLVTILPITATTFFLSLIAAASEAPAELADLERIAIADTMVMVPMGDGVRLATDIYRPKEAAEKIPLTFIKTPYDFNEIGGVRLSI